MPELEREKQAAAMPFLLPLRIVLILQLLFNLILPMLACGSVDVFPQLMICGGLCFFLIWGMIGLISLQFLRQLFRPVIYLTPGTQFVYHLFYVVQLFEHGLFVVLLWNLPSNNSLILPLVLITMGLCLALLTNFLLVLFVKENPVIEFDVNSRPPLPLRETADFESTGDWDQAKHPPPKP